MLIGFDLKGIFGFSHTVVTVGGTTQLVCSSVPRKSSLQRTLPLAGEDLTPEPVQPPAATPPPPDPPVGAAESQAEAAGPPPTEGLLEPAVLPAADDPPEAEWEVVDFPSASSYGQAPPSPHTKLHMSMWWSDRSVIFPVPSISTLCQCKHFEQWKLFV